MKAALPPTPSTISTCPLCGEPAVMWVLIGVHRSSIHCCASCAALSAIQLESLLLDLEVSS